VARTRPRRHGRPPRAVLILAAYPRRPAAERAASLLVRERLVACATVVGGARAVYVWKGRRHIQASTLLYGKTTAARAREAVRRIRETHPDQVSEILVLDIVGGNAEYLAWIAEEVGRR